MERIQCQLGERADALENVRAAVALCREREAELELVGIVQTSRLDPPQPAFGERVRRFKQLQRELLEAVRIARGAGLSPIVSIREDRPERRSTRAARRAEAIMGAPARLARRIGAATGTPAPPEPGR